MSSNESIWIKQTFSSDKEIAVNELIGLGAFFVLVLLLLSRMTRAQTATLSARPHPEQPTKVNPPRSSSKAPVAPRSHSAAS